jgi:single-strand DNA-binding protein
MKSVNKVTLLGNATRDPEIKTTTGGQSVCTFGLATNRVWRDSNGEKQSLPEYHNLVAWGGLAEFCAQNIRKGKPLYIEGYLKTRSWDTPQGIKIFRTEVVVENLILLGVKEEPVGGGEELGKEEEEEVRDIASEPAGMGL